MRFRFKAFGWHLLGSATVLTCVLGTLYLGWYRWPGWFLTDVPRVALMLAAVDVALGPCVTLLIANPRKPRSELLRDVSMIVLVQLAALVYGTTTLWQGRPLFYAFSVDRVELVQAHDIDADEMALARRQNPAFVPHWYSLPRWIWAPLPNDAKVAAEIMRSSITGGNDVIQMPRYFKPWQQGLDELRKQLRPLDQLTYFSPLDRKSLRTELTRRGFDPQQPCMTFLTGHARPVLLVFDPHSLELRAELRAHPEKPVYHKRPAAASKS
jgi:hypothetical protein